jgi:hypothetical protein
MSRPWKHPDSGFYWFRKRVPDDLRNLVGRREEKFSLGTRDPIEAKRLHALRLAEVEERWSNLRNGQRALSPDDIAREALAIGDHVRRQLEADPYQPLRWDVEIGASLWGVEEADGYYTDITQPLNPAESKRLAQRARCYGLADERLAARGLATESDDRGRLARAVSLELQRTVQDHQAYLLGRTGHRLNGGSLPALRVPGTPLTFETIIRRLVLAHLVSERG